MQNIEINNDILNKVENIIKEKEKEKIEKKAKIEYIKKCIKAKICPICGEQLLEREPTKEEEINSHFDVIEYILYCEKSEFIHIEGYYEEDYD